MKRRLLLFLLLLIPTLAACGSAGDGDEVAAEPTDTLAPLVSLTPRLTATPPITRTPLPTETLTPSETPIPPTPSNTPVPTATPPIVGIIQSLQTVNVREGPSTTFSFIDALPPGTGVTVLNQNTDGSWYLVRLEDGREGWISAALVFIEDTPTPFPTMTPSPDFTALALGTALPTALFGGGTVTATPPAAALTATPPGTLTAQAEEQAADQAQVAQAPTESFLPVLEENVIGQTATALAGGVANLSLPVTSEPGDSPTATGVRLRPEGEATDEPAETTAQVTRAPERTGTAVPTSDGSAGVRTGVDVLALCDDPIHGDPPPTNLAAGSSIDVYWAWFAQTEQQVRDHLDAVTYDIRINGERLSNWSQYGTRIRQEGDQFVRYWFVPVDDLEAGEYEITYRATWDRAISDGWRNFGPGTNHPVETGSCTFSVG